MSYVVEEKKVKQKGKRRAKGRYFPRTEKVIKLIKKEPRGRAQEIKELYSGLSYSDKLALIQLKKLSDDEARRRQGLFSKAFSGDLDEIPLELAQQIAKSKLIVLEAKAKDKISRGISVSRKDQDEIKRLKKTFPELVKPELASLYTEPKPTETALRKLSQEEKRFKEFAIQLIAKKIDPNKALGIELIENWNAQFGDKRKRQTDKFLNSIKKAYEEEKTVRKPEPVLLPALGIPEPLPKKKAESEEDKFKVFVKKLIDDGKKPENMSKKEKIEAWNTQPGNERKKLNKEFTKSFDKAYKSIKREELPAQSEGLPAQREGLPALGLPDTLPGFEQEEEPEEEESAGSLPVKHVKLLKRFVSTHKPSKKQLINATLLLKAMHMHNKKK